MWYIFHLSIQSARRQQQYVGAFNQAPVCRVFKEPNISLKESQLDKSRGAVSYKQLVCYRLPSKSCIHARTRWWWKNTQQIIIQPLRKFGRTLSQREYIFRRHIKFSHFTRCSCHSPINVAALMAKKTIYGNVPKQCILCRVESVHEIIYMNAYHKRDKLNAARTFWFVFRAYHARLSCRQTICTNTRALKNVAFPVKPDDVGLENIQIYIFNIKNQVINYYPFRPNPTIGVKASFSV